MSARTVTIDPHHPDCRYPNGPAEHLKRDPMRCSYCAALVRQDYRQANVSLGLSSARPGEDPLDYRHRP